MIISNFVDKLARQKVQGSVVNQYAYGVKGNEIRRKNLHKFLDGISKIRPNIMLVGEAPGYKGCRLTGISFTSEDVLVNKFPKIKVFSNTKFSISSEEQKPQSEITATVVWTVLKELNVYPLLWNAFPFHPYNRANRWSNRRPSDSELYLGQKYLRWLIKRFAIDDVIAVGETADGILNKLEISHDRIRHPSHGGRKDFRKGLLKYRNKG